MMDVLKPELVWVNNKCYRYFERGTWTAPSEVPVYVEDNYLLLYEASEPCDMDIEIVQVNDSEFKHTFYCPSMYFAFIIGTKGAMRKKLETETMTTIQIPKTGQDITIVGRQREHVISARHRINLLIEASRKKLRPTHFLSIPITSDEILTTYDAFKNDVCSEAAKASKYMNPVLFQKPYKLHLTIAMLLLADDDEIERAVKLLNDCKRDVIEPILREHGPVTIQVKGVDSMNDDPTRVRIVFAKVNTKDGVLKTLADKIVEYYADSGFLKNNFSQVKLHLTLMNVTFQEKEELAKDEKVKWLKNNITFDASSILKTHSETVFGEVPLKEIHLSCLGTATESYYKAAGIITLLDAK